MSFWDKKTPHCVLIKLCHDICVCVCVMQSTHLEIELSVFFAELASRFQFSICDLTLIELLIRNHAGKRFQERAFCFLEEEHRCVYT